MTLLVGTYFSGHHSAGLLPLPQLVLYLSNTAFCFDEVAHLCSWIRTRSESITILALKFIKYVRILVRDGEGCCLSYTRFTPFKYVILGRSHALYFGRKISDNGESDISEVALFDESLSAHTDVDTGSIGVLETTAKDVAGAEPERGQTGIDMIPRVVVIRDV